jgi:hypothetical protein
MIRDRRALPGLLLLGTLVGMRLLHPAASRAENAPPQAGQAASAQASPGVSGKVVSHRKPVAGVRVHAYTDAAGDFLGDGFAASAPTAADGAFSLALPPGAYYLVARGPRPAAAPPGTAAGEYFGYYGGNPVTVSPGAAATAIIHVEPRTPAIVAADAHTDMMPLKGVVLGPDGPVAGAAVHVYTDATQQFRGPDMFGPQGAVIDGTDARGAFSIEVPAGTYYLVASKRKGGAMLGHLQLGDLHGYYDGNPLRIAPGTSTSVVVQVDEKVRDTLAPAAAARANTGIRGAIHDPSGTVPAGVYAFATTDPSVMIGSMPPYRSQFLGPDGSYFIEVPEGRTYYVFARSGYGGPPASGEWNGFYGGAAPAAVAVRTGSITQGVDFVVKKAP